MKIGSFFSLLIVVVGMQVSCASKKEATNSEVKDQTSQTGKVDASDSLFATLERGYCFGKCPVYTVKIYNSGYAVYEGKDNVDMVGTYTTRFTKNQLATLTKTAKEIDYMSLNDVYDSPVTDLPTHISSIVIDGKRKEVKRRHKYPESILVYEKQIDALVAESKWTQSAKSE